MDDLSRGGVSSTFNMTRQLVNQVPRMLSTHSLANLTARLISTVFLLAVLYVFAQPRLHAGDNQSDTKQAGKPIDFAHDVAPILQSRCAKCHTGTQKKGGLSLNNRQTVLAGGDGGPVVVLKKSGDSALIERVLSDDANERMPPEGERLTAAQIDFLRRWIDDGLPWEDGFAFGKMSRQAPLAPRRPAVPDGPAAAKHANPIDRFLHGYFVEHHVRASGLVSDRVFARRASFDLVG